MYKTIKAHRLTEKQKQVRMSFYTNNGVFTKEQIKKQYNYMLRKFNPNAGDMGFSWIQHVSDFALFNLQEIVKQVKFWRKNNVKAFDYNNKEFEVDGRKWYVLIAQPYKDGEMEECGMCVVSMLLFGTWVNGYTYAFAEESQRDLIFRLINDEKETGLKSLDATITFLERETKETPTNPICMFCKKECENEFGNNPYPLAPKRVCEKGLSRCCGDCNRKEVIPARINGVFRCENITTDGDRQVILDKCMVILVRQFEEVVAEAVKDLETKTPNDLLCDPIHSQFKDYPTIKSIDLKVKELRDQLNLQCIQSVEAVMEYVKKRFQSHLNVRSISSPKEICATTKTSIRQAFNSISNQILTETKELQLDLQQAIDTIRKNIENELVATQLPQTKQEDKKKDKVMTKQELTRQANKSKNQKEKERLEFEARVAEANRVLAEQEKKKKQQAIEKKKREQKKLVTV
jgi:hypothetical protein